MLQNGNKIEKIVKVGHLDLESFSPFQNDKYKHRCFSESDI